MRVGIDLKNNFKYRAGIAHHFTKVVGDVMDLDPRNTYVQLAPNGFREPALETARAEFVDVPFPVHWGRPGFVFYDQVIFPRYANRARLDVLLAPYYDLPIVGALPPVVAMVHDLVLYERRDLYPRAFAMYYVACLRSTLRRARHILTLSEYSKQRIVELLGIAPERLTVLPCTIGRHFRRLCDRDAVARRIAALGVRPPYVLYSGGVDARKNLPRLFAAVAEARRRVGPLQLVCVGEVDHYAAEGSLSAAGAAAADVHLPGRVSTDDLITLYNGASAVLYPSLYEGFGFPVAEAMACGTPVVCSDTTSLPEVGGDAPFYCSPLDTASIADAVVTAVTDRKQIAERVARGLRQALRHYENDNAPTLLAILEAV
jgi:glycosyltransferase involved in cell wall biosynthesis